MLRKPCVLHGFLRPMLRKPRVLRGFLKPMLRKPCVLHGFLRPKLRKPYILHGFLRPMLRKPRVLRAFLKPMLRKPCVFCVARFCCKAAMSPVMLFFLILRGFLRPMLRKPCVLHGFLKPMLLEASKTRYSVQTEKWLARNENEPFWQWFWARGQKCLKTSFWRFQKPDSWSRAKNGLRVM